MTAFDWADAVVIVTAAHPISSNAIGNVAIGYSSFVFCTFLYMPSQTAASPNNYARSSLKKPNFSRLWMAITLIRFSWTASPVSSQEHPDME
jgi:hypothetical protein